MDIYQNRQLTPERWLQAYSVLSGGSKDGVSLKLAAEKANVSYQTLRAWIRRSRERRVDDEPWIWNIAEMYDSCQDQQVGTLEDVAWKRAIGNKDDKGDNRVLMRLLERRDPGYKGKITEATVVLDVREIAQRMLAVSRQQSAKKNKLVSPPNEAPSFDELIVADNEASNG